MTKIFTSLFILLSISAFAQNEKQKSSPAVSTIDGIVNEVLRIVSGEEGKIRDWDAFRNLFLPTARLSVLMHGDSLAMPFESVTVEEFIESMDDEYYEQGYIEYEINSAVDEYNGLANVFQTFYGKDSENIVGEGINSYQLVKFNNRWWIVNLVWTVNDNGVEVPEKYLGNNKN